MNGGDSNNNQSFKHVGKIVENVSEDRTVEVANLINVGEVDVEELVEVAPMLKTSKLKKITEHIEVDRLNTDNLISLAPFLDSETLDELVTHVLEDEIQWQIIMEIAPFLSEKTWDRLIKNSIDGVIDVLSGLHRFLVKKL